MTTCQKIEKAVVLFLDSARGQYIPRDFAQCIKREFISGISTETLDFLAQENSNESPDYWDVWFSVLDTCKVTYNGGEYMLHQDGDLWLLQYERLTHEERASFGFED